MPVPFLLKAGVIATAAYAIIALIILIRGATLFGRRLTFSKPAGSARQGIIYAFFKGMLPWEKESVANHLPTFIAGLFYHLAIFLTLFFLALSIIGFNASESLILVFRGILIIGLGFGVGLLIKRLTLAKMRLISTPDDLLSNLIVDLFLYSAFLVTISEGFKPVFFIIAMGLFLYIPLGKIRHCVFFFYSRIGFGILFGRRGVLPHPQRKS